MKKRKNLLPETKFPLNFETENEIENKNQNVTALKDLLDSQCHRYVQLYSNMEQMHQTWHELGIIINTKLLNHPVRKLEYFQFCEVNKQMLKEYIDLSIKFDKLHNVDNFSNLTNLEILSLSNTINKFFNLSEVYKNHVNEWDTTIRMISDKRTRPT